MFSNLSWYEVVILMLVALFIFGDKLPKAIADFLRLLRNLRQMARNATADLSRELGTDIQLEDLHPKTFIRKHVLSEADQEALVRPLKGISEDVTKQARSLQRELTDIGRETRAVADDVKRATDLRAAPPAPSASTTTPSASATESSAPAPAPRVAYDDVT